MYRLIPLFIFISTLWGDLLLAQSCTTHSLAHIHDRLARNQADFADLATARETQYIPIAFHIVSNNDGSDRLSDVQLLDMLCILNGKFSDQDIQFYLTNPPVHYLQNTGINNQPGAFANEMKAARIENAINVFITNNINANLGAAGYYLGPAGWDGNDFIVVARNFIYSQNVFPHEVGHFFSLLHPFHGWENNPWNEAQWGNPVATNAPSDPGIFSNPVPTELQNGSNCATAGDRICDTPPDYLFALNPQQSGCNPWSISVQDPSGTVVNPQENNIMSYFGSCSDYIFTTQQKAAINSDLMNAPERAYIRQTYIPNMTAITSIPDLLSPAQGSTLNSSETVSLSWFPVFEAQYYAVEIDISPGFSSPFRQSRIVEASVPNTTFDNLESSTLYYWRVRPFTEHTTCTGYSDRGEFTTAMSVSTENIISKNTFNAYPNPIQINEILTVETNEMKSGSVRFHDLSGKTIQETSFNLTGNETKFSIPIKGFNPGIYFMILENEAGRKMKKILVR